MELSERQQEILRIVKQEEPITSQELAHRLNITRAALRADLAVLTMTRLLEAKPRVGYFYNTEGSPIWLKNLLWGTSVGEVQGVPVAVHENTSLYDAAVKLFLENVSSLFVLGSDSILKGQASARDLLKVMLGNGDYNRLPVSVAMNPIPGHLWLNPADKLYVAIKALLEREYEDLPVVYNETELVGRINRAGILRFIAEKAEKGGPD